MNIDRVDSRRDFLLVICEAYLAPAILILYIYKLDKFISIPEQFKQKLHLCQLLQKCST